MLHLAFAVGIEVVIVVAVVVEQTRRLEDYELTSPSSTVEEVTIIYCTIAPHVYIYIARETM